MQLAGGVCIGRQVCGRLHRGHWPLMGAAAHSGIGWTATCWCPQAMHWTVAVAHAVPGDGLALASLACSFCSA